MRRDHADRAVGWASAAVLLLALVGCAAGGSVAAVEATAEAEVAPEAVLAARDSVLKFLRRGANECVPPEGAGWRASTGVERTPEGFGLYRFDTGDCVMRVIYPLPATDDTIYHVLLSDSATGFCWQATVDANGRILKTGAEAASEPGPGNPALVYCEQQGYQYELRDVESGTRCGACVFPDGSACKAWDYLLGLCEPGDDTAAGG